MLHRQFLFLVQRVLDNDYNFLDPQHYQLVPGVQVILALPTLLCPLEGPPAQVVLSVQVCHRTHEDLVDLGLQVYQVGQAVLVVLHSKLYLDHPQLLSCPVIPIFHGSLAVQLHPEFQLFQVFLGFQRFQLLLVVL